MARIEGLSLAEASEAYNEDQLDRLSALARDYDLSAWSKSCTAEEWRRNLHLLDWLDRTLGPLSVEGPGLDVGSATWWYLPALFSFRPGSWTGREIAPNRRYSDGSTRGALARWRCEAFAGAKYESGAAEDALGSFALVTCFLPYLVPDTLRADGLPDRFLRPQSLVLALWERVLPGGALAVLHQEPREARAFAALCRDLAILGEEKEVRSPWNPWHPARIGWIARKEAQAED